GNGETCVTKTQLDALLAGSGSAVTTSTPTPTPTPAPQDTEAPVITIQGNNPAEIFVGTSYADLGALFTDDTDPNLTTYTLVNGATTTDVVSIDTSVPRTHTITYIATDDAGNTTTKDRMVNVVSPTPISEPLSEPLPETLPITDISTTTPESSG
ncbi:MAG: immunoglobulin-like domain-containing protein, partial [Patescibacteria group bacterium]